MTSRFSTRRRETWQVGKSRQRNGSHSREQLTETDAVGAEQAYRKVLELAPSPHYHAYTNLGVLLCEAETRCDEALSIFDDALEHFPDDALLHFNRAVVLEELKRYDAASAAYQRCLELDPTHADAHFNLARLSEIRGDKQGLVRHLSAYRRLVGLRVAHDCRALGMHQWPCGLCDTGVQRALATHALTLIGGASSSNGGWAAKLCTTLGRNTRQ